MEIEAELKGGRGADQGMIASVLKKGNTTKGLVGGKQASNYEKEPERKEARGTDQIDLRHRTQEMMMAACFQLFVTNVHLYFLNYEHPGQHNVAKKGFGSSDVCAFFASLELNTGANILHYELGQRSFFLVDCISMSSTVSHTSLFLSFCSHLETSWQYVLHCQEI